MQTLINLAVKFSGMGWIWEKTDGIKTYIAAAAAILTGLGGVLQALSPLLAAHDAGALFAFVKSLPHDQSWLLVVSGLGLLGVGHGIKKAADAAAPTAPDAPKP